MSSTEMKYLSNLDTPSTVKDLAKYGQCIGPMRVLFNLYSSLSPEFSLSSQIISEVRN